MVALVLELLGGLGLRNETLAARGRIEVHRRCAQRCLERFDVVTGLYHEVTSPRNLQGAIERWKLQRQAADLPQL